MSPLWFKTKRLLKKRGSLVLIIVITTFFVFQYTSLSEYTSDQIANLRVNINDNNKKLYSDERLELKDSDKKSASTENEDGETVPFYKSRAAQKSKQKTEKNKDPNDQRLEKVKQISMAMENDKSGSRLALGHELFNNVFEILKKGEPKIPKLERYKTEERIYHAGYDAGSDRTFTEEYLGGFLDLTTQEIESLKASHEYVVKQLPDKVPKRLYNGNGIVYVGGGKFNWLALLSIKSLRSLDCTLPVEVLIPTIDEYEIDLCSRVFPALNAKCILLPHVLGDNAVEKFKFKGYQYKALALIVSSFENVLLLDSDNVPVHAPDHLFENEPFKSAGLITWPDFWRRATSPHYYTIAGIEVTDERVRFGFDDREKDSFEVPLHDRKGTIPDPTSESGQLMISKNSHTKELFLALYYNLYGPDYYYPLFSQGSDGEGDKETFLAATVALNSSYYQVKKFLNAFGHFNLDHEFIGTGMGQYDPVEDYQLTLAKSKGLDLSKVKDPRILFVHANFPKLNPVTLKEENKVFDKNGNRIRLYGPGMAKRIGYDFELVQWRSMYFLVCDLRIDVAAFNSQDTTAVCREIKEQLTHLENTVKDNERD